ncbi:MAG: histidinol-phosphatase HisJ family protein [Erysipelotrichaceae bacterium]|nr:histidinol-phosphatase HisJ family protein [Erysipelotrichaceae bacterium]
MTLIFICLKMNLGEVMKTNYHTHTSRCKHAYGSEEDYIQSAIKAGITELGFSDHTPWPFKTANFEPRMRMKMNEYQDYLDTLQSLKEKYKDQISIRIGLECEYYEEYIDWLKNEIDTHLDFVLFGNHYAYPDDITPIAPYMGNCVKDKDSLEIYVQSSLKAIESGLFSCFAHPDLFMRCYPVFDEHCIKAAHRLSEACAKYHLPMELNLSAFAALRKYSDSLYPSKPFYEIAKSHGCEVLIGWDAHCPDVLEDDELYQMALNWIEELGLPQIEKL